MTLSETTHATVEQVEVALDELETHYRILLKLQRAAVMDELAKWNAGLRKSTAARRKKLELYRDVLKAEGPSE